MAGSTNRDTCHELEHYDLTGKKIARIYVMDSYNGKPIPEMKGEKNIDELTDALKISGFEVDTQKNLEEVELMKNLKSVADIPGKLACLWIFLFAKSDDECIRCYKGFVALYDILAWLKLDKCNNLIGKPKMLFVQVEVGENYHEKNKEPLFQIVNPGKVQKQKKLPITAEITVALFKRKETDRKGGVSLRQYISEELKTPGEKSIFDIMTSINGKGWKIAPTFCTTFRKQLYLPPVEESSGTALTTSLVQYTIHGPKKAYSFVFKHFQVEQYNLSVLEGADADKKNIADAMEKLDFKYEDCNKNWKLTANEMKEKLKEIAKNEEKSDCVMIFVSTHGIFDGKDTIMFAFDGILPLSDLWTTFDEFPGFKGKPKIIIFDGCRELVGVETMFPRATKRKLDEADHDDSDDVKGVKKGEEIPDGSDLLIGLASVKGNISLHNTQNGSLYIVDICEKLTSQSEDINLLDILISANGKEKKEYVEEEGKEVNQLSTFQSTLRKKCILKKCKN